MEFEIVFQIWSKKVTIIIIILNWLLPLPFILILLFPGYEFGMHKNGYMIKFNQQEVKFSKSIIIKNNFKFQAFENWHTSQTIINFCIFMPVMVISYVIMIVLAYRNTVRAQLLKKKDDLKKIRTEIRLAIIGFICSFGCCAMALMDGLALVTIIFVKNFSY